jgi:hypothetical protein
MLLVPVNALPTFDAPEVVWKTNLGRILGGILPSGAKGLHCPLGSQSA